MRFPLTTFTSTETLAKICKPIIFSARKYLCVPQKVILRLKEDNWYENSLKMQI